jgi:hypothetical protein
LGGLGIVLPGELLLPGFGQRTAERRSATRDVGRARIDYGTVGVPHHDSLNVLVQHQVPEERVRIGVRLEPVELFKPGSTQGFGFGGGVGELALVERRKFLAHDQPFIGHDLAHKPEQAHGGQNHCDRQQCHPLQLVTPGQKGTAGFQSALLYCAFARAWIWLPERA